MGEMGEGLLPHLQALYGEAVGRATCERLLSLIRDHAAHVSPHGPQGLQEEGAAGAGRFGASERDAILITYPDQVQEPGKPPLRALGEFCAGRVAGLASAIHILPFYPSTSDDGFAVVNYREVDAAFGDWGDLAGLGQGFRLMFDAVFNHVSAHSAWFQGFLRDDPTYRGYFIVPPPGADLSRVVRPRPAPADAIRDAGGAQGRLDDVQRRPDRPELPRPRSAVEYPRHAALLCRARGRIHPARRHRLFVEGSRHALHPPAAGPPRRQPVPGGPGHGGPARGAHHRNERAARRQRGVFWRWLPRGADGLQLRAATADAAHVSDRERGRALARWAGGLSVPSPQASFFNFLASHDGIGLNPARGLLSDAEVNALEERTRQRGGLVSYKDNPDGTRSAYELNISYWDALCDPQADEPLGLQVDRFIGAQAVMLALAGVPGIYFHSLFGLRGWPEGVRQTGQNRTINRRKCRRAELDEELAQAGSRPARVYAR